MDTIQNNFDIFRKLRPSYIRIWLVTPCHPWVFRENQDGVQDGHQKGKTLILCYKATIILSVWCVKSCNIVYIAVI